MLPRPPTPPRNVAAQSGDRRSAVVRTHLPALKFDVVVGDLENLPSPPGNRARVSPTVEFSPLVMREKGLYLISKELVEGSSDNRELLERLSQPGNPKIATMTDAEIINHLPTCSGERLYCFGINPADMSYLGLLDPEEIMTKSQIHPEVRFILIQIQMLVLWRVSTPACCMLQV
ncbi:hypothetical protein QAD02_017671 [Eretmocerus hayati]|uniref:Uncharacterized protein n=1 Tax=Eretmocerus hayati TaxID=131215 RepID=A0ACC2PE85_9HYME|nr:hypothetical protein QAD02_017671 [Eretmocerus hayati]